MKVTCRLPKSRDASAISPWVGMAAQVIGAVVNVQDSKCGITAWRG